MKHTKSYITLLLALVTTQISQANEDVLARLDLDSAGPDPRLVYVESIYYGGTGCPQGSLVQGLSEDRSSLSLVFDKFVVSAGPGVPITENRKNCQINLNLRVPQGWSYSVAQVNYLGFVQLAAGQTGSQKSIFYFQGDVAQISANSNFSGPVSRDYLTGDFIPVSSQIWSSCNGAKPLNINTQVRISSPQLSGQITTDSIDGKVKQILKLSWKRC